MKLGRSGRRSKSKGGAKKRGNRYASAMLLASPPSDPFLHPTSLGGVEERPLSPMKVSLKHTLAAISFPNDLEKESSNSKKNRRKKQRKFRLKTTLNA